MYLKYEIGNLCTENFVNVSQRILDKKTFITKDKKEAEKLAKKKRSYLYELFDNVKGKLIFWGYAVPN